MKVSKNICNRNRNIILLLLTYTLSILAREILSEGITISYTVLAFSILLMYKTKREYLKSNLSSLDLFYASAFSGLVPRYISVMILGLMGQLVIGPPRLYSLPLLTLFSIIEEFYFRAKLYDELESRYGRRCAYLTTICLYAIFHIPLVALFKLLPLLLIFLLLGVLFQELRLRWGLTSAIIAHIIYNIVGVFYTVSFEFLSVFTISISLIIIILLIKFLA